MKGGVFMKKMEYIKPDIESYTEEELMDVIIAGASCPNCYSGCNYFCW